MVAASPIDPDAFVLESAVRKLRADEPLDEGERAAIRRRGLELMELTRQPLSPVTPGGEAVELDDDETEDLCAALVEAETDRREGKTGIPWRELFPARAAG